MNQQGIGTSSLSTWVGNCDLLDIEKEERVKLDDMIDKLYEDLDEGTRKCFFYSYRVFFTVTELQQREKANLNSMKMKY